MNIESLRSFLAFVETGSFTRVAQQTYRTQGAISMQMKQLELELNQSLFTKQGRAVVLTREGKQLVSYARKIVSLHDEAVSQFQSEIPLLRVGCPDDFANTVLVPLLNIIHQQCPKKRLQITTCSTSKLRQLFDNGELDLAVITRQANSDEGYFLLKSQGVWIGNSDLLDKPVLPLVLYEADCRIRSGAIDSLEKSNIAYQIISESDSATAILAQVDAGIGLCPTTLPSIGNRPPITTLPNLPSEEIALLIKQNAIDTETVNKIRSHIW